MQYDLYVTFVVQDEQSGTPRLHHPLHLSDEFLADPGSRGRGGCSDASQHSAHSRPGQRRRQHQTGEEPNHTAGQDVADARETLSVEREGAVGMTHDHCDVLEDDVFPGLTAVPRETADYVANLFGPRH